MANLMLSVMGAFADFERALAGYGLAYDFFRFVSLPHGLRELVDRYRI